MTFLITCVYTLSGRGTQDTCLTNLVISDINPKTDTSIVFRAMLKLENEMDKFV